MPKLSTRQHIILMEMFADSDMIDQNPNASNWPPSLWDNFSRYPRSIETLEAKGYLVPHTNKRGEIVGYTVTELAYQFAADNISEIISEHNNNRNMRVLENSCPKCGGTGYIREFSHVAGGVCFYCNGKGHK